MKRLFLPLLSLALLISAHLPGQAKPTGVQQQILGGKSASGTQQTTSPSLYDLQKTYDKLYPNQKLVDQDEHATVLSGTGESTTYSLDSHADKKIGTYTPPDVTLPPPKNQSTATTPGTQAHNPPTSTLQGLTELKNPMEMSSHYGPPTSWDYPYLALYTPPPTVPLDVGPCFSSQAAAESWFQKAPPTLGIPVSDAADYINKMTLNSKLADQITSPSRWIRVSQALQMSQQQDYSNGVAAVGEAGFGAILANANTWLPNIANEYTGAPVKNMAAQSRSLNEFIWMVQQAYSKIFLPIGLLLLLPGALMTQGYHTIARLFNLPAPKQTSPFAGILKAVIALFLIPSTQLIVSYSIDVGNSLASTLTSYGYDVQGLVNYANAQLYDVPFGGQNSNFVIDVTGNNLRDTPMEGYVVKDTDSILSSLLNLLKSWLPSFITDLFGGSSKQVQTDSTYVDGLPSPAVDQRVHGKVTAAPEEMAVQEAQSRMTTGLQIALNTINSFDLMMVSIMMKFQLIALSYLYMLGPVAAALYCWPSKGFREAFARWVNAVITVSLWRFYWCAIVVCMNTRIYWLADTGDYKINSEWESLVFLSFMTLMAVVPIMPYAFKTEELVKDLMNRASSQNGGSGGSGGNGSSASSSAGTSGAGTVGNGRGSSKGTTGGAGGNTPQTAMA